MCLTFHQFHIFVVVLIVDILYFTICCHAQYCSYVTHSLPKVRQLEEKKYIPCFREFYGELFQVKLRVGFHENMDRTELLPG